MSNPHNLRVVQELPKRIRIATPPGVGDTYWCLAKLKSFRERHGIEHVTLCTWKDKLQRKLMWPSMVPGLVDAIEEFEFAPNAGIRDTGFSSMKPGVDIVMWPNAVLDRGGHIDTWMPDYETDLEFEIKTERHPEEPTEPYHIVFASWGHINKAWFPGHTPDYWNELIKEIGLVTGETVVVIGAYWDVKYATNFTAPHINMTGKTNSAEVAGLIKRARSVTGHISGMTILANHFQTPCLANYPDHFMPGFIKSWIKPETPYVAVQAKLVGSPRDHADRLVDLLKNPGFDIVTEHRAFMDADWNVYPRYLERGNAAENIYPVAQHYCKGTGLDIGGNVWGYPGAQVIDPIVSPGFDAYNLPKSQYDYIFSSHCLEHLERPGEALTLWHKHLKKGGRLFLYLPHPDCKMWSPDAPGSDHKNIWLPEDVAAKLDELGFKDIEYCQRDMFWSFAITATK